jgi:hypothetical protein
LDIRRYDDRHYAIDDDLIHPDLHEAIEHYLAFFMRTPEQ